MVGVTLPLDPPDRLLLDEAAAALAHASDGGVVVLDDPTGGLTTEATVLFGLRDVRVNCDSLLAETAVVDRLVDRNLTSRVRVVADLGEAVRDATLVLMRLPKSLAALDEIAELITIGAAPEVRIFASGRTKHMSMGMNTTLARHFSTVTVSLGRQKSRVLRASKPHNSVDDDRVSSYPRSKRHEDVDLEIYAHGAAFAGTEIDHGTRLLLDHLPEMVPTARDVVDLGCGTGVLATSLARARPGLRVRAIDESAAAYLSAKATAAANGVGDRVQVARADGLRADPADSVDLIVCNPPFHIGTARESSPAYVMFDDAGRVLRSGGELWTVFNTHLPYRSALRRVVGATEIVAQNSKYCVARSIRR